MDEMIDILKKELSMYEEMLKISTDKKELIIKDNVNELEEITKREEKIVKEFIEIEKERLNILRTFSKEKGLVNETPKIPELAEYFPEQKEELMELRKKILDIVSKVKAKNDLNEKLIKNSLDYINFSVGLATGSSVDSGTYGKGGNSNKAEAKKFFDIKL